MSRFGDDYDPPEHGKDTSGLYRANLRRALRGTRGRQALSDLRDALLALPEKRLIEGALCTVGLGDRIAAMPKTRIVVAARPLVDEAGSWLLDAEGRIRFGPPTPEEVENYERLGLIDFVEEHDDQPEGVCAVGAYVWWQKVKAGTDPAEAFAALPVLPDTEAGEWETTDAGKAAGLAGMLAWKLAHLNDERFGGLTPEARYERFMEWIDATLAAGAAVQ